MSKIGQRRKRSPQPLPMVAAAPKALCCEEKYGITVWSKSRRCRRCPKVWKQR